MRVLDAAFDIEEFFARLAAAPERILFLDYDGTLAPFHVDPARARPYPVVETRLRAMARESSSRIVLVSGRPLANLRQVLGELPAHEAWGTHGWEHVSTGNPVREFMPSESAMDELATAEASARTFVRDGARVERKLASVAFHWRGLPLARVTAMRERMLGAWSARDDADVELLPFDGGLELRARGRDKGRVVDEVLAASHPGAVCAYLGDDFTDEDAFEAVRRSGRGVAMLVRPELRPTAAHAWLYPPVQLERFLRRWTDAARGEG